MENNNIYTIWGRLLMKQAELMVEVTRLTAERDRLREYIADQWKYEEGIDDLKEVERNICTFQPGDLTD